MGVYGFEFEFSSSIAPAKLFKSCAINGLTLLPKVSPQAIKSCEILEGNGGPGSINKISFAQGSKYGYAKIKVDVMDEETLRYSYSVIEGEGIGEKFEKIEKELKIEANENGGSVIKASNKFYAIGEYELEDEELDGLKGKGLALFTAIEAYLLANPDFC